MKPSYRNSPYSYRLHSYRLRNYRLLTLRADTDFNYTLHQSLRAFLRFCLHP